jgi:hypothetical protein
MTGLYLTDLADVCRRALGDEVFEVEGWEYRARGSGGYADGRPWAFVWHHTASDTDPANDVNYICYGNPDAPVANLYLDRDGAVWVCAGGATNTNGKGGPVTVSKGVIPLDQLNTYAVSMEIANAGTGQPWPQVQVNAAFAVSLAVCAAYGLQPDDVLTHYGWCEPSCKGRKIDPATADAVQGAWRPSSVSTSGTWSQDDLRAECRRRATVTPPPTPEDEDMTAATLWRPQGYLNVFLIGAGSTVNVSPEVADSLTARGVPTIVEAHQQMLDTCLFQCGLTPDDLVPGGG